MKRTRGFTLIELLVVISIIGLLASITTVYLNEARMRSRDSRRISDIKQISLALALYYDTYGNYPHGGVFVMSADSRSAATPPNNFVPSYNNLTNLLVPNYIASAPLPPRNNKGDGGMCGNCDEYRYTAKPYGTGYSICTYVALDKNKTGQNAFGSFYCIYSNCDPGSESLFAQCMMN